MLRFEDLEDRLLRGGVAYRHVRRFTRELSDHYDDAVGAEAARGLDPDAAHAAAMARLGSVDDLARSMMRRPDILAIGARYPRLWNGGAPIILWIASVLAFVLAGIGMIKGLNVHGGSPAFAPLQTPADIFVFLLVRALPVAIGGVMLILAMRQRMELTWPLTGIALLAGLAGAAEAFVFFSLTPENKNELSFSFGVTSSTLLRMAGMFALMLTPLALKKYLTRHTA